MSDVAMSHQVADLYVQCDNEPGVLERLLRVVRFRGFSVERFMAEQGNTCDLLKVMLRVRSERPVHLLESQLRKNESVRTLMCESVSEQGTSEHFSQPLMPATALGESL